MVEHAARGGGGRAGRWRASSASARVLIGVEADKPRRSQPLQDAARSRIRAALSRPTWSPARCATRRAPSASWSQRSPAASCRRGRCRRAVGVLVQNVATAVAVHDAVRFRRPLLDRVLTVTGPGVSRAAQPAGADRHAALATCVGLLRRDDATTPTRIVAGGPMMGRALPRLDVPVIKGMNGLVLLDGRGPLERRLRPVHPCGRCLEACPLGLEPDQVSVRVEAGRALETEPLRRARLLRVRLLHLRLPVASGRSSSSCRWRSRRCAAPSGVKSAT